MTRDKGLEEILNDDLRSESDISEKAMFGGWAWMVNGRLLCCSSDDGMLLRLGEDREDWALQMPGVVPMFLRDRRIRGWVRIAPAIYGNDSLRQKLLDSALMFVRSLPEK